MIGAELRLHPRDIVFAHCHGFVEPTDGLEGLREGALGHKCSHVIGAVFFLGQLDGVFERLDARGSLALL